MARGPSGLTHTLESLPLWVRLPLVWASILAGIALLCESALQIASRLELISLGVVEERYEDAYSNAPYQVFDSTLGWKLRTSYRDAMYQTNAMGLRSSVEWHNTDQSAVMLLGDSMVFGLKAVQPDIFSETLNQRFGRHTFVNTGVNGYTTKQEYLHAQRLLPVIKPKLVVLFYTQVNDTFLNDRNDAFLPFADLDGDGRLIWGDAQSVSPRPLYKSTASYRFLSSYLLFGKDVFYFRQRLAFTVRREASFTWRITSALVQALVDEVSQRGAQMVIVDIPGNIPLLDPLTRYVWGHERRETMLRDLSERVGVPYYNLRDVYPQENVEALFVPGDSHWNKDGHEFIATWLTGLPEVRALALVPSASE